MGSPALLIAAWLVTAAMTITGALSYGELAAMMPKAGGQYVYLREALGPLWGFLYGWTLFLVIQTGTIAAVGVAFGKFLGVFFPSVSATNWLWHIAHVPAIPIGPMVLGNMDIGLNTANLAAIVIIVLLTLLNTFGVKLGSSRAERVYQREGAGAAGGGAGRRAGAAMPLRHRRKLRRGLAELLGRLRLAYAACGAGGRGRPDGVGGPADGDRGGAGGQPVLVATRGTT